MPRKTTALVPTRVAVQGEFDDAGDATSVAMRILQKENERLAKQNEHLHAMLTGMHTDMVDDRKNTRSWLVEFEQLHFDNVRREQDLLDRKQERKLKADQERAQSKMLEDGFAMLKENFPYLLEALRKRGAQPEPAEVAAPEEGKTDLETLRDLVSAMSREERAAVMAILLEGIDNDKGAPDNGSH